MYVCMRYLESSLSLRSPLLFLALWKRANPLGLSSSALPSLVGGGITLRVLDANPNIRNKVPGAFRLVVSVLVSVADLCSLLSVVLCRVSVEYSAIPRTKRFIQR